MQTARQPNYIKETTLGAAVESAYCFVLRVHRGFLGVLATLITLLFGRVTERKEYGMELVRASTSSGAGETCGGRFDQILRPVYHWLARRWTEKVPPLGVIAESQQQTVDGAGSINYKGVLFPAKPLLILSSRATALKTPWTRVEVGMKLDQFQRAGLLKLADDLLPFMADYVCLIHAFCWLSTTSIGHDALALHCRSVLRTFWTSPVLQAECGDRTDTPVSPASVPPACSELPRTTPGSTPAAINLSVTEVGTTPVSSCEDIMSSLPEPPAGDPQFPVLTSAEPAADLSQFDWGVDEDVSHERAPPPVRINAVNDAVYGEHVPARASPPTVGTITTRLVTSAKSTRPTRHYRLLDLPVAETVVFYDRNSAVNAQAAFRHRVARVTRPYSPSSEQRVALQRCADALAHLLQPTVEPYVGALSQVKAWLGSRHYPLARRKNLIRSLTKEGFVCDGYLVPDKIMSASRIQAFIKNEPYLRSKSKPPRMICARDDAAKMLLGPLFQPLDDMLFTSRFSVKHLSDADRPDALRSRIGPGRCLVLDYTAYESSQRTALQADIEMRVYCRCLETGTNSRFVRACLKGLSRRVPVLWDRGTVKYVGPLLRYSGEVTTSLGNTINNIVCITVARAVADQVDLEAVDWGERLATEPLVVEGDDSVQAIPGQASDDWIARLIGALQNFGLEVRPEVHTDVSEAGFCGVRWNQSNGHRYSRDPLLALAKLCWTSSSGEPEMALALKAEALSIQAPDQPLLCGICHSLRRDGVARGVTLDRYDLERYQVMGLRVLPMAGASYSVKLTRGALHLPDASDYQLWAQEWGVDIGTLQQADAAAAVGDYRLLRAVLARLVE